MSIIRSAPIHFAQLCIRALQKNAAADNVWLTKNVANGTASLTHFQLNKSSGAESVEIEGVSVPVYVISQQIHTSIFRRLFSR